MNMEILDINEFLERVQNDKGLLWELLDIFVEDLQKILTNLVSRELVRMDVSNPKSPTVQFLRRPRK